MSTRVQVILDEDEREIFRWHAQREGLSLSAWLRRAAQEKIATQKARRMTTIDDLKQFFADCDDRERGQGREPEWDEHLQVLLQSRSSGFPST